MTDDLSPTNNSSATKPATPPQPIAKADFDEAGYLRLHPDVATAVRERRLESGHKHYLNHGLHEGRLLPGQMIGERNHMAALPTSRELIPSLQALSANSFDALLLSPKSGMMITGWIDDAEDPINCIRISSDSWQCVIGKELLVRDRRPTVEELPGLNKPYCYGYFGFLNFTTRVSETSDCTVEILLHSGACVRSKPKARLIDEVDLRNDTLGALINASFFGNPTIESFAAIGDGFANQVIAFNQTLTKRLTASPYVERFGPQKKAFKGSIIICLYGKCEFMFVQNCLYAGLPGIEDYEFIYVSNSPELAEPLLREAKICSRIYGLSITIVILAGNAGFGSANNAAAKFAQSDRLLIVNPDVFPYHTDWARRHSDLINGEAKDKTRLFGVPLYYDDGSLMHGGMYFETDSMLSQSGSVPVSHLMARVEHYGKGAPVWATQFTRPRPVPAVTGAFISIERSWFEKLDGFNESYVFGHYEDADLCLKSITQGTLPWLHDIRMWHLEGKGSTRMRPHEGGSLINRWLFTNSWGALIQTSLDGPAPSYPGFETSAPVAETAP